MSKRPDSNLEFARKRWGRLPRSERDMLQELCTKHGLCLAAGHLLYLDNRWYITHAGLIHIAFKEGCSGIRVSPLERFCKPEMDIWAFEATAYRGTQCKGFSGFGDATPDNVSTSVRGAEMRIAETRAVNRALRKAYGIGLCSMEEIGSPSAPLEPNAQAKRRPRPAVVTGNCNGNGHHLRDRLLVLIRQHKLDGVLVKAYAADFCGVKELREASREQVQDFINHLSEYVANDRDGLLCQLNSYALKQESAA